MYTGGIVCGKQIVSVREFEKNLLFTVQVYIAFLVYAIWKKNLNRERTDFRNIQPYIYLREVNMKENQMNRITQLSSRRKIRCCKYMSESML